MNTAAAAGGAMRAPHRFGDPRPGVDSRLEHLSQTVSEAAAALGINLTPVGSDALFRGVRLYDEGGPAPWIVARADDDPMVAAGLPIPKRQRAQLEATVAAGFDFPSVYVAHELQPGNSDSSRALAKGVGYRYVEPHEVSLLLPGAPAPTETTRTATRLDRRAKQAHRMLITAGTGLAGAISIVAAAPVLAISSLASLDPAILGAVTLPGTPHHPGNRAAWFIIAHWSW